MKYIKTYEEGWFNELEDIPKSEPKIGDYILLNLKGWGDTDMCNFLDNNIGQLTGYGSEFSKRVYIISYDGNAIPYDLKPYFTYKDDNFTIKFRLGTIEYWSKDKEDVERYLKSKKYNL
jgi:hypothetical protein